MWIDNPGRTPAWPDAHRRLIGAGHLERVRRFLAHCPAHQATPLETLPGSAAAAGVGAVHVKVEAARMGLGSFKALGGAYAVAEIVMRRAGEVLGRDIDPAELTGAEVRDAVGDLTVVCASAGNHGLSVATGARLFGCRCLIYLADTVPGEFVARINATGAKAVRKGAVYEDSMAASIDDANANGWILVSDSSWPGNTEHPVNIMRGYLVLIDEALGQMAARGATPSHVFLQAGVGGLAASLTAWLRERPGPAAPRIVIVEPAGANCILESIRAGRLTEIKGGQTVMGRLDCRVPSMLAFDLLADGADGFMDITDEETFAAMRSLHGAGLEIGESGAAGLAGLVSGWTDPRFRRTFGLDESSQVLVIGTEGIVDAGLYARVIGA